MGEDGLAEEVKEAIHEKRKMIGKGIYYLGDKIAKYGFRGTITHQYEMGNYAAERGISIPRIYGLVDLSNGNSDLSWFIVMKKIEGREMGNVQRKDREEAIQKLKAEIAKLLDLGICPRDSFSPSNAIFSETERRVYLIDFEAWMRNITPKELEWYIKELEEYPRKRF